MLRSKVFGAVLAALAAAPMAAQAYDDVMPTDAYTMATSTPNVYIVDVRTDAEWRWVGHPGVNKLGEGAEGTFSIADTTVNIPYKIFKKEVLEDLTIRENRFGFEPEITAKVARGGWKIYEVPISYYGRSYAEGKKLTWKDGVRALCCIIKYRFV